MNQRETLLHLNKQKERSGEISTDKSSTDVSQKNIVSLKKSCSNADKSAEEPVLNSRQTVNQYRNQTQLLFHLNKLPLEDLTTQNSRLLEVIRFVHKRSTAIFSDLVTGYYTFPTFYDKSRVLLCICNNTTQIYYKR